MMPLAEIQTPLDLHAALRARAESLALTHEVIDEVSGLAGGYAGKLLARSPAKALGNTSLPLMLSTLGCRLWLVVDDTPDAQALLRRLPKRQRPLAGDHWRTKRKAAEAASALQAASAALNRRRSEVLSPEQRRSIASAAARARWDARRR